MIGSRLHRQGGDQKHDFSSFIGSVFEAEEIRSLFAFKGLPDILAIPFSYPFCRFRLLEFQVDRLLATDSMNATLETRLVQANQGASFAEVFACLVQDEMDWRKSRLAETRFKISGLLERRTLTEFDWGFNPKLPQKEIYELVSGEFIRDGADALLIGSPGTGKSHIAKTVAHAAIQTGYKVVYREAHTFFEDLFESDQLKRRKKQAKLFSETDLLVIDDSFLRKNVPKQAADDLLEIILNRYAAKKSSLITSNRPLDDWGKLLGDNAASSAILDRLLHRGHLLKFEGRSYRLKEASIRLTESRQKVSG